MTRIKYDINHMKYMVLFENITRTSPKDCIVEETYITFIVKEGNIAKAIGKKGINVKRLEQGIRKKVKIVEFDDDITIFTQNLLYNLNNINIEKENDNIIIFSKDRKTKALLIGRNSQNLRKIEAILKRHFTINGVMIK